MFKTFHISLLLLLLSIALIPFQGCGTVSNGRGWGQDATLTPGWDRIKRSAVDAALSPETWGPIAGAMVLQIGHMDKRISDWASDNNPVFGSENNAAKWSNYLEFSSGVVYFTTVMATPGGDDASEWLTDKAKGLAIGAAASGITSASTTILKKVSSRTRPNGSAETSFPSGHESDTAVLTTLAMRNIDSLSLSPESRMIADIGIAGIAVGTGWGRVEGKKHYPSDVLVGYALGHFFSAFINDAFLGPDNGKAPQLTLAPSRKGMWVGLNWSF